MLNRFYEKNIDRIIKVIGYWLIFFGLVNLLEIHHYGFAFLIPYGFTEVLDIFTFLMLIIFGYKFSVKKNVENWVVVNVILIRLIIDDISMVSFCYKKINNEKTGDLLDLINAYSPAFFPQEEMENALMRIAILLPILIVLNHKVFLKKFNVHRKMYWLTIFLGVTFFWLKNIRLNF